MRRMLLSSTLNTRDLGGYPIDRNRATTYGVFLRSDAPYQVTDEDIALLRSNQITTIVDLRNDEEVQRKPCALKDQKPFEYYHCKIHGDGRLPQSTHEVPYSYLEIIDEQRSVLQVMKVLAGAKGCALYHCTAGKDRTGVISALLLLLAGVQKADIIGDYQISQAYLDAMLEQYSRSNPAVDLQIITPKTAYMEKFLDLFLEKYTSVDAYLLNIGLCTSEITQLKAKLVQQKG